MTALQALRSELHRVQAAQTGCVSEEGYVLPCYRYKYQMLVEEAESIRRSITWLTDLYKEVRV